jgi:NADP-dependent 3-hydroxy acid dehydrogenase YdfG
VKRLNRRIVTAEVDVREYEAVKSAVDSGVEQLGRLDIICDQCRYRQRWTNAGSHQ